MANKFYTPGEQRAAKVNDLFNKIAPRYDLINDLQSLGLHRFWKRKLVRLARVTPGQSALDLCCGTGDLAFALAQCGAAVTGLDFSEAMLRVAESRVRGSKLKVHTPRFLCGDAQQIPFPDNHFDVVTIGYGLRNLSDWKRGLGEMFRVARPGGRLLVLDFGKPENVIWRGLYFAYLKCVVPLFGRIFCGDADAYGYIHESLEHYPAQKGVAGGMRELGCADVRIINLLGGVMSINHGVKPHVDVPEPSQNRKPVKK